METAEEEDTSKRVTVEDTEAYLTELVQDEMVESVIECEVNGTFYHRYLEESDEECEWGDWEVQKHRWYSYDARGNHRRSARLKVPVDYNESGR